MGFIENNKAECMLSVLTSTNMLVAARDAGTQRFFYSSSACVYNGSKQTDPNVTALTEDGRLSGRPGRRLRLGEAVHRTDGSALP